MSRTFLAVCAGATLFLFCSCEGGGSSAGRSAVAESARPAASQTRTPPPTTASTTTAEDREPSLDRSSIAADARAAVAVVDDYYRAIGERDYARAYRMWGTGGPPRQSEAAFEAGYAQTAAVRVTTGTPSGIGAAAGSRYVDVPVTIVATTKNGTEQRFEGSYTLRRAVVDGASDADRRWHIDHASLRRTK